MDDEVRRRRTWIRLYEQTCDVGLVCRRCGISGPTLRKWLRRYEERSAAGLVAQSRRPKHSPRQKVFAQEEAWMLELRRERNLGARRIQHELRRLHNCRLGLETIHVVLQRHQAPPLRHPKRQPAAPASLQHGAAGRAGADGHARSSCAPASTSTRSSTTAPALSSVPSPRGAPRPTRSTSWSRCSTRSPSPSNGCRRTTAPQFLADTVRDRLLELRIKHRPIRPASPHLNGKVERAQKTVLDEFYATTALDSPTLADDLGVWLMDYNYRRVHGSLGKTPMQRWAELNQTTPYWDDVIEQFDPKKEADYVEQLPLRRHSAKPST